MGGGGGWEGGRRGGGQKLQQVVNDLLNLFIFPYAPSFETFIRKVKDGIAGAKTA